MKIKKAFMDWIKSPLGLSVLLVSVIYHGFNWPAIFYIENEYNKLEWVEIDDFEFSKSGGRYGDYRLRITGLNGERLVFSTFGFLGGESKELVNVLKKNDKIGWYTTCFPWKSGRIEGFILSSNCAVIMEISREGEKYISFDDRLGDLEKNYLNILLEIYLVFVLFVLFSIAVFLFFCKRNYK